MPQTQLVPALVLGAGLEISHSVFPNVLFPLLITNCQGTQVKVQARCWPRRRLGLVFLGFFTHLLLTRAMLFGG